MLVGGFVDWDAEKVLPRPRLSPNQATALTARAIKTAESLLSQASKKLTRVTVSVYEQNPLIPSASSRDRVLAGMLTAK